MSAPLHVMKRLGVCFTAALYVATGDKWPPKDSAWQGFVGLGQSKIPGVSLVIDQASCLHTLAGKASLSIRRLVRGSRIADEACCVIAMFQQLPAKQLVDHFRATSKPSSPCYNEYDLTYY